jgi:hypothetical protein
MCALRSVRLLSTKVVFQLELPVCSSQLSSLCQSSWHSMPTLPIVAHCSFHHGTYIGPLRPSPKLSWARRRLVSFNLWPPMVPTVLYLTSYSKGSCFPHGPRWPVVKFCHGFRLGRDEGPAAAHPPAGGGA